MVPDVTELGARVEKLEKVVGVLADSLIQAVRGIGVLVGNDRIEIEQRLNMLRSIAATVSVRPQLLEEMQKGSAGLLQTMTSFEKTLKELEDVIERAKKHIGDRKSPWMPH